MSQSAPPKVPGQVDPIRQQLDELDALLQRMLDLPVSPPEPEPPPESPNLDDMTPLPPPLPPRVALPPVVTPPPYEPPSLDRPPDAPLPARPPAVWPRPTTLAPRLSPTAPEVNAESLQPTWVVPLVWINRGYDALLTPLGPVGRWLREPFGRACLGWAGVLFAVAAVALLLFDWLGWTRLPGLLQ